MRTFLVIMALAFAAPAVAAQTRNADDHFFSLNTGDLKAEAADARAGGKKGILIMFEQDGCPACAWMKANVLNRVDVQAFYRERFVSFMINTYGSVPITDFGGRSHSEKAFAASVKVTGTPTFLFYALDGTEAMRIVGPVRSVEEFKLLGEFVASGAYRTRKFAEYQSSTANR